MVLIVMLDIFTTKPFLDSLITLWSPPLRAAFREAHKKLASICLLQQQKKGKQCVTSHNLFYPARVIGEAKDCVTNQNSVREGGQASISFTVQITTGGETSEGVPCSFAYSSLAVRSNLAVKIVAPRVPDTLDTENNHFNVFKNIKTNLCL